MNECFLLISLVFCISDAFTDAVSITSPDLQRKIPGESCKLQWIVTGTFTNYTIESFVNENPITLTYGYRRNTTFDQKTGVITLLIWNIQLSDAGDYLLHLHTGSLPDSYSIGTFFVYGEPLSTRLTLVSGPNPGKEGDNYEIRCTFASTSEPAKYRTKVYYFWGISYVYFQNVSSGSPIKKNGDVMSRYTIKNGGQNLVITSARVADNVVGCQGQEEGSPYKPDGPNNMFVFSMFEMRSKPYVTEFKPPSRKLTASSYSGTITVARFWWQPRITSYTNWTFVSSNGTISEFPVPNDPIRQTEVDLTVQVNSAESYGNYSISVTNMYGTRTETLQVLPPGPPDTPTEFIVQYVTHNIISLQWRCMWNNGFSQTVFVRLIEVATKKEIDTMARGLPDNCYDSLNTTVFQQNLEPDTQYQAFLWSVNELGSTNVQSLMVRTQNLTSLYVSCEDISVTRSQAIINVSTSCPSVVWLNVTCCVELMAECITQSYTLLTPMNKITVNNIPTNDNYVFDFTLFNGNFYNYVYVLAVLKGIRVSRISSCTNYGHKTESNAIGNPPSVTTISMIIILGVVVLFSIGIFTGFLIGKRHQRKRKYRHQQLPALPEPNQNTADELLIDDHYDTINYYPATGGSNGDTYFYEEVDRRDLETIDTNGFNEETEIEIPMLRCQSEFNDHQLLLA